MCGSATLRIVLSIPCMMLASMIEAVIMPRLATGGEAAGEASPPLIAAAPAGGAGRRASPHPPTPAARVPPSPRVRGEGGGEGLLGPEYVPGGSVKPPAPARRSARRRRRWCGAYRAPAARRNGGRDGWSG